MFVGMQEEIDESFHLGLAARWWREWRGGLGRGAL
jgi:hypothetical protein